MNKLINPPIQALLLVGSLGLLVLTGWSLLNLKMQGVTQARPNNSVSVSIPDARVLDVPALAAYPQMVQKPLFWESRNIPEVPNVKASVVENVPVDTSLPEGRLIGIVDVGDHLFGIMQDANGKSTHLRKGDSWGAWTVTELNNERLLLAQGSATQVIPLVGDFAVPQENPQLAQARAIMLQQQAASKPPAHVATAPVAAGTIAPPAGGASHPSIPPSTAALMEIAAKTHGLPFPADMAKQPPALSVQEALEARQRLMASRWGSLSGETQDVAH